MKRSPAPSAGLPSLNARIHMQPSSIEPSLPMAPSGRGGMLTKPLAVTRNPQTPVPTTGHGPMTRLGPSGPSWRRTPATQVTGPATATSQVESTYAGVPSSVTPKSL